MIMIVCDGVEGTNYLPGLRSSLLFAWQQRYFLINLQPSGCLQISKLVAKYASLVNVYKLSKDQQLQD